MFPTQVSPKIISLSVILINSAIVPLRLTIFRIQILVVYFTEDRKKSTSSCRLKMTDLIFQVKKSPSKLGIPISRCLVYVEMDGTTCVTLTITIATAAAQTWDILVSQIETGMEWEAPVGKPNISSNRVVCPNFDSLP